MPLSPQDALVHLMVVTASSDTLLTEQELKGIDGLIAHLPVFEGYDRGSLARVANECIGVINALNDVDAVLDRVIGDIPVRLQDTAYALAVEVAVVDMMLEQEELRVLEMIRDRLSLDRLVTAAVETAARARYRRA